LTDDTTIKTRFTFPKAEHLKSRKAIEQLFKTGKTFFVRPYKVFYQMVSLQQPPDAYLRIATENQTLIPEKGSQKPEAALQVGFAVSSKNFKHAVDRNRVKRIGREAYRLNKSSLMNKLTKKKMNLQVFFVYADKALPDFVAAQEKMKICLERLVAIAEK